MGKGEPRCEMSKADYSSGRDKASLWRSQRGIGFSVWVAVVYCLGFGSASFTSIFFRVGAITIAKPKITTMPIMTPLVR
jgi:hypothetical protein